MTTAQIAIEKNVIVPAKNNRIARAAQIKLVNNWLAKIGRQLALSHHIMVK